MFRKENNDDTIIMSDAAPHEALAEGCGGEAFFL
jgi:hypothetical protein